MFSKLQDDAIKKTNLHSKPSIKQAIFQSLIWDSEFPAQSHCAYLNSVLLQYIGSSTQYVIEMG